MVDVDDAIRSALTERQRRIGAPPPFPLSPIRTAEEAPMKTRNWSLVVAGVALAAVWILVVVVSRPSRSPIDRPPAAVATTLDAPGGGDTDGVVTIEVPVVAVGASGAVAEDVLPGVAFGFFDEQRLVDLRILPSEREVWDAVFDDGTELDVVEIGFRLDAAGGLADDRLLPIDTSVVPVELQHPAAALDANVVAVGIDSALGLFSIPGAVERPEDWPDLLGLARAGEGVLIPGPPLDIAVVFVHALGGGDPAAGLDFYRSLVEAGAMPISNSTMFEEAIDAGVVAGAWTNWAVVRLDRSIPYDADFAVPSSGAVALPALAGVVVTSDVPEVSMQWLGERMRPDAQLEMLVRDVFVPTGESFVTRLTPSVDVGRPVGALTGFDLFSGQPFLELDWRTVAESADDIRSALSQIVGS